MSGVNSLTRALIRENRRHLGSIVEWLPQERYLASRYQYGIPPHAWPLLNLPIDETPMCTDVLAAVALEFCRPVHYLELGVSVGRNLYCLTRALSNSTLCGLDWEEPNPVLEGLLTRVPSAEDDVFNYTAESNRVIYVRGDECVPSTWQHCGRARFDLVFSDACHRAFALLFEYEMLTRLDLLNVERFFMMWDDLDPDPRAPITRAHTTICTDLARRVGARPFETGLLELNGWLGQHEPPHVVGFATTLDVSGAALVEAIDAVRRAAA